MAFSPGTEAPHRAFIGAVSARPLCSSRPGSNFRPARICAAVANGSSYRQKTPANRSDAEPQLTFTVFYLCILGRWRGTLESWRQWGA